MIDSMFQEGTDTALNDEVSRPRSVVVKPTFSFGDLGKAPFQGIGGGVAKVIAFGAELTGAFGQVGGAYPEMFGGALSDQQRKEADAAREKLLKPGGGVAYSNEAGDTFRARAKDILPDPQTTHASAQVVSGLADFAARAVGYAVTLGPLGPAAMGGDTGLEEADRLKQQGVDLSTRTKAGVVAGALNAAAVAVPLSGATATTRFAKGVAVGEGAIVGQSLAEKHILQAAGYDKIADTFDPLDPVALALGVVPGVLGAKFGHAPAKLKTEADVRAAAALTPAEQARSDAYERSPTNLASLERAIKAEKSPEVRALLEAEHAKQSKLQAEHGVAAAVTVEPDLTPAARVWQVVDALDSSRLTPDADLVGRDTHLSAVEMASDQMGRGEPVAVAEVAIPQVERSFADDPQRWEHRTSEHAPGEVLGTTKTGGRIEYTAPNPSNPYSMPKFSALDTEGRVVGEAHIRIADGVAKGAIEVAPWARRQGVATMLYSAAEKRLGVTLTPEARHTAAAEAFWQQPNRPFGPPTVSSPSATAIALEQLRAARAPPPEPRVPRELATPKANAGAASEAKTKPQLVTSSEGAEPGQAGINRAATEAAALDPDMLVHMDGMDAPMRVGDLLAKVQEEARQDTLAGKLIQAAAECDLRN